MSSEICRSGVRGTGALVQFTGRLIINFLSKQRACDGLGIGKAKATRLWKNFGSLLYEVLRQGDLEKLTYVLAEESARRLVEAWRTVSEEVVIVSFLDDHGFDARLADKVRKIWPGDAVAKLKENPYRMLAFAGWEKVDRMAHSLGVAQCNPRRQVAAVEACLYQRLDAKHTLTPHATVWRWPRSLWTRSRLRLDGRDCGGIPTGTRDLARRSSRGVGQPSARVGYNDFPGLAIRTGGLIANVRSNVLPRREVNLGVGGLAEEQVILQRPAISIDRVGSQAQIGLDTEPSMGRVACMYVRVTHRLESILAGEGLRTAVLTSDVPPEKREAWFE